MAIAPWLIGGAYGAGLGGILAGLYETQDPVPRHQTIYAGDRAGSSRGAAPPDGGWPADRVVPSPSPAPSPRPNPSPSRPSGSGISRADRANNKRPHTSRGGRRSKMKRSSRRPLRRIVRRKRSYRRNKRR